jgi:hypothetical protein
MPSTGVLQLKVTLLGTRPPIWRRLVVPSDMTLLQLHRVIQTAMGWYDSHLHEFEIDGETYGSPDPAGSFEGDVPPRSERTAKLVKVLGWIGAKARYTYDFGDGWDHAIVVEKMLPAGEQAECPACVGGKRRCPPEDCGGVGGYEDLLRIIADPKHEEYQGMIEWLGGPIDPEAFSLEAVNEQLAPMRRRRRSKATAAGGA